MSTHRPLDYSTIAHEPKRTHPQALQVTNNFVSEELVRASYESLRELPPLPSGFFWVDMKHVAAYEAGDTAPVGKLAEYLPSHVATLVFEHFRNLLRTIPDVRQDGVAGFELWFHNIGTPVTRAAFHLDHDVPLAEQTGQMRLPLWGSILYLGPDAGNGLVGGGTLFNVEEPIAPPVLDSCMQYIGFEELAKRSDQWVTVPFKPNRAVVFRGTLPHSMAPIEAVSPTRPRVNLLANLWAHAPTFAEEHGFCRFSPAEFAVLRKLSPEHHAALAQIAGRMKTEEDVTQLLAVLAKMRG